MGHSVLVNWASGTLVAGRCQETSPTRCSLGGWSCGASAMAHRRFQRARRPRTGRRHVIESNQGLERRNFKLSPCSFGERPPPLEEDIPMLANAALPIIN